MATRTKAQKYLVRGGRLRGEIALARHQWDEAADWLHQALTRAQTLGNPTQLWKTHVALGRLQTVAKRPEQARQAYYAARQVVERVQARLQNPALRASLAHALPIS
jgi:hypothetical protein